MIEQNGAGETRSQDLEKLARKEGLKKEFDRIKEMGSDEEIIFLWNQVRALEEPKNINKLEEFIPRQRKLGAWVDGLIPPPFEPIDPNKTGKDFRSHLYLVEKLLRQRNQNISVIEELEEYPLEFSGGSLESFAGLEVGEPPTNWRIELDPSAIECTLDFFTGRPESPGPKEIAGLEVNQEMLKHRRNLGYLPEPVTGEEELAELLSWSVSQEPLDRIWKWLSPMNIFDLGDVYRHRDDYGRAVEALKGNWEIIKAKVLNSILNYVENPDFEVNETFGLTVGYGIRGWVTEDAFGLNVEYVKDDFRLVLGTLAHELFHRIQPRLWTGGRRGNDEASGLASLTKSPFESERDRRFYEILAYIALEGTGEFIRHDFTPTCSAANLPGDAREGVELLERCYKTIYEAGDADQAEKLLERGLKSNGPFYSLGEFITAELVKVHGSKVVGRSLCGGGTGFFLEYLNLEKRSLSFSRRLEVILLRLDRKLKSNSR